MEILEVFGLGAYGRFGTARRSWEMENIIKITIDQWNSTLTMFSFTFRTILHAWWVLRSVSWSAWKSLLQNHNEIVILSLKCFFSTYLDVFTIPPNAFVYGVWVFFFVSFYVLVPTMISNSYNLYMSLFHPFVYRQLFGKFVNKTGIKHLRLFPDIVTYMHFMNKCSGVSIHASQKSHMGTYF